jgi:hypothetical protein
MAALSTTGRKKTTYRAKKRAETAALLEESKLLRERLKRVRRIHGIMSSIDRYSVRVRVPQLVIGDRLGLASTSWH